MGFNLGGEFDELRPNRMFDKDQFLLGTFASNCSGGMTVTKIEERWDNSWDNNLKLARLLDQAGIDFMLPIARWIGYGGETNFHRNVLETITWAAGLLARTENLTVFATVHTAANHPVVVAKQIATLDQIGHGRVGLNIVAGWNRPEYEALGLNLPTGHDEALQLCAGMVRRRPQDLDPRRRLQLGRRQLQAEGHLRLAQALERLASRDPQCRGFRRRPRLRDQECQLPVHARHRPGALQGAKWPS